MTTMRVVGECFFWYRLTRVFPDKFHRAVKRLCVCVCDSLRLSVTLILSLNKMPLNCSEEPDYNSVCHLNSTNKNIVLVRGLNLNLSSDRSVATGWTGLDMSTSLLPEVVPEIDANSVSFYREEGLWGRSWFGA